jgi:hypothetical protein
MMKPAPDGNVVLYFDGDHITHSARMNRGILISKWGRAHTWQHGLWEVPTSYGSRVEYYQAPPADSVATAYLDTV